MRIAIFDYKATANNPIGDGFANGFERPATSQELRTLMAWKAWEFTQSERWDLREGRLFSMCKEVLWGALQ
ncbi:MAG: hypothetical protein C4326_02960 [Ignavibacteria bacterium]